jgi:hypothetical protein
VSLSIPSGVTGGRDALTTAADGFASRETRTSQDSQRGAAVRRAGAEPSGAASGAEAHIDARIWDLLSGEERAFYLQHAADGPSTYAPAASSGGGRPAGRHLGGHVDLRV